MIRIQNECVDCGQLPCWGNLCPNSHVMRCYCDKCRDEVEANELYVVEGSELCEYCVLEKFSAIYCEKCGTEAEELFNVDGSNICEKCTLETFPTVPDYYEED